MKFGFLLNYLEKGNNWRESIIALFFLIGVYGTVNSQNYYDFINKAELLIVDSSYFEALQLYDKAFFTTHRVFAKDLFNASHCALLVKKDSLARRFILLLATKGVRPATIRNIKEFESLWKDSTFQKTYYAYFENFQNNVRNNYLYKKLDSLYIRDQYYRQIAAYQGGISSIYQGVYKDSIFNSDKANAFTFKKLIDDWGFPHEDIIGVGSIGYNSEKIPNLENYLLLIWHQSAANISVNFRDELIKAVNENKITPQNASFLIAIQEGKDIYGNDKAIFKVKVAIDSIRKNLPDSIANKVNKWVYRKLDIVKEYSIDSERKKINLMPISHYRRIVTYSVERSEKPFIFSTMGGKMIYEMSDINSIKLLLKDAYLLE